MKCWHCNDTDSCDCVTCGKEAIGGWKPGPCQACKGRKRYEEARPFLIANGIDSSDPQYWEFIGNKHAQSPPKHVFIGYRLFDESRKSQ
jgi:hypothetical protein